MEDRTRTWLSFTAWLRTQAAAEAPEADQGPASEGHTSNPEPSSPPSPSGQLAGGPQRGAAPAAPAAASAQRRQGRSLQPASCGMEDRLLEGYLHGAQQEMSLLLAAPGLPAHRAPIITAKQATSLLRAISEPLVRVEAGRLTRSLASPAKLQPTAERGELALWLLPNDDLALTWQAPLPAQAAPTSAVSTTVPSSSGGHIGEAGGGGSQQVACGLAVWEALAHFPEHAFSESEEPVAVIHTLRGDASGRSFYIRPRADIAATNAAEAAEQLRRAEGGGAAALGSQQGELAPLPRLYFWLLGRDVAEALQSLGRMKSLLRRPPTLARRSGVPQKKLREIGSWLAAMQTSFQQRRQAAAAGDAGEPNSWGADPTAPQRHPQQQQPLAAAPSLLPGMLLSTAGDKAPALASARMAAALASVVQAAHAIPLASVQGAAGRAAQLQPAPPPPPTAAAATASGTVSASASAVYMDRRFNLTAPVAVTVVAMSVVQGGASDSLQAEAIRQASAQAQVQAQRALESSGRRLMEEQLAESVLSTICSARSSSRQRAAQHAAQREEEQAQARRFAAAMAMPAIRAAAARAASRGGSGGGGRRAAPAAPAPQAILPALPAPVLVRCSSSTGGRGSGHEEAAAPCTPPAAIPLAEPATPPPLAPCGVPPGLLTGRGQTAGAAGRAGGLPPRHRRSPAQLKPAAEVAAAPSSTMGVGKVVTLDCLQGLLAGADGASSCGSGCGDGVDSCGAPAASELQPAQQQLQQKQQQQQCSSASSEAAESEGGSCCSASMGSAASASSGGSSAGAAAASGEGKALAEGASAGRDKKVSFNLLLKILNGCLDA